VNVGRVRQRSLTQMARSGVHADDYAHSIESAKADRTNPAISGRASTARIVLYSHDTMGLGHVRRNLLIAQALQRSLAAAIPA
jgi:hypothetical protein